MIRSFIYPDIDNKTRDYNLGSDFIIRKDGDWTPALTPFENQGKDGVEPSSCFVEANQSAVASLKEFLYNIQDENYSARFNALLSNGTPEGGDPLKGAQSIKRDGLIPQAMMDWKDIKSWSDFHSWLGVDKSQCITKGQEEAREWEKTYKIIFERDEALETKYFKLGEALRRSPCPISVYAWAERDGKYYKPKGVDDTHLVTAIKLNDDNSLVIKDTYEPYIKVIEPNTDFDFCMGWKIRKLSTEEILNKHQKSLIIILQQYVIKLFRQIYRVGGEILSGIFQKRN